MPPLPPSNEGPEDVVIPNENGEFLLMYLVWNNNVLDCPRPRTVKIIWDVVIPKENGEFLLMA